MSNEDAIALLNFIVSIFIIPHWNSDNNIWNLDAPIGGNYWNNFDTTEEGCNDGIPDLMVKFDRQEVIAIADANNMVKVEISGNIADKVFKGSDEVRIME